MELEMYDYDMNGNFLELGLENLKDKVLIIDKTLLENRSNNYNAQIIYLTTSNNSTIINKILDYVQKKIQKNNKEKPDIQTLKRISVLDNFQLTPQEKKIYIYLEQGKTRSEIAKKLVLSEITIRNAVSRILKKMAVKNSREAILKVKERVKNL